MYNWIDFKNLRHSLNEISEKVYLMNFVGEKIGEWRKYNNSKKIPKVNKLFHSLFVLENKQYDKSLIFSFSFISIE